MMHFYATIRNFVERHASNPDPTGETKLSQTHLWPILLATYYPLSEQAAESYLDHHIRSENSKSCIVTRVIIDFVVNRVWNPSAWAGADADSTYAIMEVERDLERTTGEYIPTHLASCFIHVQEINMSQVNHLLFANQFSTVWL